MATRGWIQGEIPDCGVIWGRWNTRTRGLVDGKDNCRTREDGGRVQPKYGLILAKTGSAEELWQLDGNSRGIKRLRGIESA